MSPIKRIFCGSMWILLCGVLAGSLNGCSNLNDPYGYGGPYGSPPPYYSGIPFRGGDGSFDAATSYRQERRELERERDRLADERRRLEQERARQHVSPPPQSRPANPDRCPPGFQPSELKCTPQERRKGCRDMRMPSGLGCVDRR